MKADDFRGRHDVRQGQPWPDKFHTFSRYGFCCVEVLHFLNGKPWDDVALAFVESLRPTHLRVISPGKGTQIDAQTWRVTVYLNDDDKTIEKIKQEVQVGLPDDVQHGGDLLGRVK